MNKKYLSVILFGALMLGTTGTFTSCKDYDDDINNLQEQITANADAIKKLQDLVGDGKFVTGVTSDGNTITFTFSDNSTVPVTIETEQAQKVEVKGDELYIDDQPIGIKVAKEAEIETGLVKAENGTWWVLGEDGKYTDTGIPVSGLTVVGNEKDGWELTITDAEGNEQVVKVPSAVSSITDLIVVESEVSELQYHVFNYTKRVDPKAWGGPRTLPSANTNIVAATNKPVIQINPTTISPIDNEITFSLVDSKNNYPSNVTLTAENFTDLITKAANPNGLYALIMQEVSMSNDVLTAFKGQFNSGANQKGYAVTAGGSVRSEYVLGVKENTDPISLTKLSIVDKNEEAVKVNNATMFAKNYDNSAASATNPDAHINANEWYYVIPDNESALYDMHLSVSSDDKTLFGVEIEESVDGVYRFRVTETPDNITKAAFELTIETIDKEGNHNEATVWVGQTKIITTGYTYDEIPYMIKNDVKEKNFFSIALSEMKNHLGEQGTALWNTQVTNYDIEFYKASDMNTAIASATGIIPVFKKADNTNAGTAYKDASTIEFQIDNETAGDAKGGKFSVNTHYVAVITFKAGTEVLNTINVPFIFSIPAINTLFVIDPGFVKEGVASCYLYADDSKKVNTSGAATFNLKRIFSKMETTGYTVALDDKTVVTDNKKSADLAYVGATSGTASVAVTEDTYITLEGTLGEEVGYNQSLNLTITGAYAAAWTYPEDEVFNFQVRIMSPIEQGKVVPAEGAVVSIPASELDGYHFSNDVITGYTYNSQVSYKVLPVWDASATPAASVWSRNDISAVTGESGNSLYFTVENSGKPYDAEAPTTSGSTVIENDGYFLLKGYNVDHTVQTTIKIKVTDIWNRVLTAEVPVEITVE